VMDLDCGKAIDKENCVALTNVVIDELVKIRKYTVIDRANRDKILGEAKFQMTGCVADRCTIEAGRILGVGKMVVGSISKLGQTYLINLQLLNVETAAVETSGAEECKCELDGLIGAVRNTARKIMGEAPASSSTPQQPAQPPAKLKTNGKCPEDMIYVPEGNFCIDIYEYPNKKGATPKANVSLDGARKLCQRVQKRLPTPEEWEMACMGQQKFIYGYGPNFDKTVCNSKRKNITVSGELIKCKNNYELYDMVGNLWEWTDDSVSALQWLRGGSTYNGVKYNSCKGRYPIRKPNWQKWDVGFRCAKDAE